MQQFIFYVLATGLIITALITITTKKSVTAAISMVGTMFFIAGLYALLNAHLIAALQVIVYAGAIMVLTLFVIMLLNVPEKEGIRFFGQHRPFVLLLGIIFLGFILIKVVLLFNPEPAIVSQNLPENFGTVKAVGLLLYTKYLLQFEIASILLLAAIVGAVIMTHKSKKTEES